MKKLFLAALFLMVGAVQAQPQPELKIWTATPGGVLESTCRQIFNVYEKDHNERVIVMNSSGFDGIIPLRAMLSDTAEKKVFCHGASALVQNRFVHANTDVGINDVTLLIKYSDQPTIFYSSNKTPKFADLKSTMDYFRSLNRPINVGSFSGVQRALYAYLATKYNVNLNVVAFRRPLDMYPSIIDGGLDFTTDFGPGFPLAQAGRYQVIGYFSNRNDANLPNYRNWATENNELLDLTTWLGISVPRTMSADLQKVLTERIERIVRNADFVKFGSENFAPSAPVTGKTADQLVQQQVRATERLWKTIN